MSDPRFYQERLVVEEVSHGTNVTHELRFANPDSTESERRSRLARYLRSLADSVEVDNALEQRYPGLVKAELIAEPWTQSASQWYGSSEHTAVTLKLQIPRGVA